MRILLFGFFTKKRNEILLDFESEVQSLSYQSLLRLWLALLVELQIKPAGYA